MTFSIIAIDRDERAIGVAAATGNLAVGGWVPRAAADAGAAATQGASPSPLWGDDALVLMRSGASARDAIERLTRTDVGRASRQLACLDLEGRAAAHTGEANVDWKGHRLGEGWVAAGNWLAGPEVLDAMAHALGAASGPLHRRLLAAIEAGAAAGGDARGLFSAALRVVSRSAPPLDLRVDWGDDCDPIARLETLRAKATQPPYSDWSALVPTLDAPHRA